MSSTDLKVLVRPGGDLEFVYDDRLASLCEVGEVVVTERASHVEPAPVPGDGVMPTTSGWTADMAPSGGPVLGPFKTRGEALTAERLWLRENRNL